MKVDSIAVLNVGDQVLNAVVTIAGGSSFTTDQAEPLEIPPERSDGSHSRLPRRDLGDTSLRPFLRTMPIAARIPSSSTGPASAEHSTAWPESLHFGKIPVGGSAVESVIVKNVGSWPLPVSVVAVTDTQNFVVMPVVAALNPGIVWRSWWYFSHHPQEPRLRMLSSSTTGRHPLTYCSYLRSWRTRMHHPQRGNLLSVSHHPGGHAGNDLFPIFVSPAFTYRPAQGYVQGETRYTREADTGSSSILANHLSLTGSSIEHDSLGACRRMEHGRQYLL